MPSCLPSFRWGRCCPGFSLICLVVSGFWGCLRWILGLRRRRTRLSWRLWSFLASKRSRNQLFKYHRLKCKTFITSSEIPFSSKSLPVLNLAPLKSNALFSLILLLALRLDSSMSSSANALKLKKKMLLFNKKKLKITRLAWRSAMSVKKGDACRGGDNGRPEYFLSRRSRADL